MAINFHETAMGQCFFGGTLPSIANSLESIASSLAVIAGSIKPAEGRSFDAEKSEFIGQLMDIVEDAVTEVVNERMPDAKEAEWDPVYIEGERYDRIANQFKETLASWNVPIPDNN